MSITPIRPEDVAKTKLEIIPDYVIKAFNHLIAKNIVGKRSRVDQSDVISLILQYMTESLDHAPEPTVARAMVFNNHWLDVEGIYREAGWKVEYDKPGYNESYGAFFIFTAPRK